MLNFDYLNNLNEKQKEAVTHLNGPLLIDRGIQTPIRNYFLFREIISREDDFFFFRVLYPFVGTPHGETG